MKNKIKSFIEFVNINLKFLFKILCKILIFNLIAFWLLFLAIIFVVFSEDIIFIKENYLTIYGALVLITYSITLLSILDLCKYYLFDIILDGKTEKIINL